MRPFQTSGLDGPMVLRNDAVAGINMMAKQGKTRTGSGSGGGTIALPVVQDRSSGAPMKRSRMGRRRAIVLFIVQFLIIVHVVIWLLGREYGWFGGATVTPIEPSESMEFVKRGVINAGLIFFVLALLSTLAMGRWFCGWGCHVVLLQDACLWMLRKVRIRPKPFRSRLLMWAPLILAFYMFIWPLVHRLLPFFPGADAHWELGLHLTTKDFWATFPGLWVGIVFLFICGFVTVYFLGAKGFCTYGCPYGGFFAPLDRWSPGSIRVTDDCQQCGHCTAVCTSNVRVHEEVHAFGMVTDAGCMKTMDCIDTCPNDALYFGFGASAARTAPRAQPTPRKWDVTLWEDIALAAIFLGVFLCFRGAYASIPLLMAMGISAVLTYLFFLAWQLASRPNVHLHRWRMKLKGRLRTSGVVFLIVALLLVAFTVQTGAVNWIGHAGSLAAARAMRSVGPNGLTESGQAHAQSSLARFNLARDIGITTDPNHDADAIQMYLLLGDMDGAGERLPGLIERFPGHLRVRRLELEYDMVVSPATVEDHVETMVLAYPDLRPLRIRVLEWQVSQGAILAAEAYARRALASDEADDETRLRLAMLLVRSNQVEEGTEHVRRYLESQGANGKAWMLLGEALAMQQQMAEADMAIERAMQLDSSPIVLRQAMMHYMNSGRRERANAIMERLKLPLGP